MGLDYAKGCVNFRDVGEFVNLIAARELMPEKKILRGGKLDFVSSLDEIGSPKTIINLRKGADVVFGELVHCHFPISNDYEKYNTIDKEVRRWLNKIIKVFENGDTPFPVIIHCTSGKDRTGVVVAALLWTLRIPEEIIIEEYLLSESEVRREWIEHSLDGIKNDNNYFDRVDLHSVRRNILAL